MIIFWAKRWSLSGHSKRYPDIFVDIFRTFLFHRARKFKDITKEFGQFIPKEVILGGRAYFEEPNALIKTLIINAVNKNFETKCEGFKLVGGVKLGSKNSNELIWTRPLEDFRNWDCIKFKDPVSIFQPLSKDLRKQILTSIGKKLLYTNTEDCFINYFNLEFSKLLN